MLGLKMNHVSKRGHGICWPAHQQGQTPVKKHQQHQIPYVTYARDRRREVFVIWVRSWKCGCRVTWICYQMIAKPGKKAVTPPWPDLYTNHSLSCDFDGTHDFFHVVNEYFQDNNLIRGYCLQHNATSRHWIMSIYRQWGISRYSQCTAVRANMLPMVAWTYLIY